MGQDPRTLYYAIPGFQQSPDVPNEIKLPPRPLSADKPVPLVGKTALDVVTELEYVTFENDGSEFWEGMTHRARRKKKKSGFHIMTF
jgi:hypothetical protein